MLILPGFMELQKGTGQNARTFYIQIADKMPDHGNLAIQIENIY